MFSVCFDDVIDVDEIFDGFCDTYCIFVSPFVVFEP